jgi:YfiH family protein
VAAVAREAADWLWPAFSAPGVRAVMTTRQGGVSVGPFAGLNVRPGIGDDPEAVSDNRRRLAEFLGVPSRRVDQVHGAAVQCFEAPAAGLDSMPDGVLPVADASVTALAGLACEIHVADCLPVLFADRAGRAVGAAHAGWRGLAAGVLEATLARVCALADQPPSQIEAWLGACIGPTQFEVGAEVVAAFGGDRPGASAARFVARPVDASAAREGPPKWLANLPGLARDRLAAAGVGRLFGNDGSAAWCTVSQPARFYSYRRDRQTGRMAALIWRQA